MKTKKILIFSFGMFCLLASFLIPSASSRYKTQIIGSDNINVAKWIFKVNSSSESIVNINLSDSVIVDYVYTSKKTVIPGSFGTLDVIVDCSLMEVALDYEIKMDTTSILPANIHFYLDESYENEIDENTLLTGTYSLDGDVLQTYKIYWNWVYTEDDESEWINKEISFNLIATATQKIGGDSQ